MKRTIEYFIISLLFLLSFSDAKKQQSKRSQKVKVEHCNIRIADKEVFLIESSFSENCPRKDAELAFVSNYQILEISKCYKRLATEKTVIDIEVLPVENLCDKKCVETKCSLHYVLELQKYVASCKPKTMQQKQISLCQVTDSKNNSYSNYDVVVLLILISIVLTSVGVLTYLYRRHKTTNISETAVDEERVTFLKRNEEVVLGVLEEKKKSENCSLLEEEIDELPTTSSCMKSSLEIKQKADEKQTSSQSFVNAHNPLATDYNSMPLRKFLDLNKNFCLSYFLVLQIIRKIKKLHNQNFCVGSSLKMDNILIFKQPFLPPDNIGFKFIEINFFKIRKTYLKLTTLKTIDEGKAQLDQSKTIFEASNNKNNQLKRCETFSKQADIYYLSVLMFDILFSYVKEKMSIPDAEYFAERHNFFKGNSMFWKRIPKNFLNMVEGIEIWITVGLVMDGCSERPSDRPDIEEFERRFVNLKLELNALIEEDRIKFGESYQ